MLAKVSRVAYLAIDIHLINARIKRLFPVRGFLLQDWLSVGGNLLTSTRQPFGLRLGLIESSDVLLRVINQFTTVALNLVHNVSAH